MKKLTEAQIERLNCLQEEAAEIVQAASKILRFGFESKHPSRPEGPTNREHLEEEIGNLMVILEFMSHNEDVDDERVNAQIQLKSDTIGKYLRFQE